VGKIKSVSIRRVGFRDRERRVQLTPEGPRVWSCILNCFSPLEVRGGAEEILGEVFSRSHAGGDDTGRQRERGSREKGGKLLEVGRMREGARLSAGKNLPAGRGKQDREFD